MKLRAIITIFLLIFPALHAQEGTVTGIAWNGSTWLISYYMNGSHLVEYDGQKFVELKLPVREEDFNSSTINFLPRNLDYYTHLNPRVAGWFRDHWVLGGIERVAKYDGKNFIVMPFYWSVYKLGCAESSCLAYGVWPGPTGIKELFEYKGAEFTLLTDELKNITNATTQDIAFAWYPKEGYWLVAVYGHSTTKEGKIAKSNLLLKYREGEFKMILELPENFLPVITMNCNDEYCILGSWNKLAIYNGKNLSFLPIKNIGEIHIARWGGKYWLVGTNSGVIKLDGRNIEKIQGNITVNNMKWNGRYWLIGGRDYSLSPKLVKYSGESFEDLTGKMLNASSLRKTVNQTIKKPEISPTEEMSKAICGPSLILLLPVMMLLIIRFSPGLYYQKLK